MNILLKRILAGSFDLLLTSFAIKAISLLSASAETGVFIIYTAILLKYQTTFGGIIFGLKTSSLDKQELSTTQSVFKALLMWAMLMLYGILVSKLEFNPIQSIYIALSILSINILPTILLSSSLAGSRLMLHDIISRTCVEIDENRFSNNVRNYVGLTFIFLTIFVMTLFLVNNNYI